MEVRCPLCHPITGWRVRGRGSLETAVATRPRDEPNDTESHAMTATRKIRQVKLVGGKIRQLRKEHKLTQNELASRIGVQQSDLSRMEKGEYRVSLDTLFKILSEFDLGIGEFFDEMARNTLSPNDVELVQSFRSLPRGDQKEVEEFIRFKQVKRDGRKPSGSSGKS